MAKNQNVMKKPKLIYKHVDHGNDGFASAVFYAWHYHYYPLSNMLDKYRIEQNLRSQLWVVQHKVKTGWFSYKWQDVITENPLNTFKQADKLLRKVSKYD